MGAWARKQLVSYGGTQKWTKKGVKDNNVILAPRNGRDNDQEVADLIR